MRTFIGPHGLRPGWRFALFLMITGFLIATLGWGTFLITRRDADLGRVFNTWVIAVASLIAMWILGLVEGRPVWNCGFAPVNRGRNLALGLFSGVFSLSCLMAILVAAGGATTGPQVLPGAHALRWGLYWTVIFVGVGIGEESLMRSYSLFSLSQAIGFWPAAVVLSVLFGAGHLGNSGEEWIGIGNAVLAGLVLAWSVKWTGALWWAIGYHMSWDWGQSFFYGVADSGTLAPHHLLSFGPAGPGWLSGGSVGPEGSVLCIPILLSLLLIVRFAAPRWDNPALGRMRPPDAPQPTPSDRLPTASEPDGKAAGSETWDDRLRR